MTAWMRAKGTIDKWVDDKGFGFVTPDKGGQSIFVHISAFDRNIPRRPKVGDTIYYHIKTDENGKTKAFDAAIEGAAPPMRKKKTIHPKKHYRERSNKSSYGLIVICVVAVIGIADFLYNQLQSNQIPVAATETQVSSVIDDFNNSTDVSSFTCEGKTHCSHMGSCEEARFYLNNCPGTKMDGDGDGVPCERQWCN